MTEAMKVFYSLITAGFVGFFGWVFFRKRTSAETRKHDSEADLNIAKAENTAAGTWKEIALEFKGELNRMELKHMAEIKAMADRHQIEIDGLRTRYESRIADLLSEIAKLKEAK